MLFAAHKNTKRRKSTATTYFIIYQVFVFLLKVCKKYLVSQPEVTSQCLLPFLEILNEIWLLFLKDLVEDILAVCASLQGRAVDLPHLVLADGHSPDLVIGLPMDDLSGEELIQNGIQVGHSLDQLSHVFIHKVLT